MNRWIIKFLAIVGFLTLHDPASALEIVRVYGSGCKTHTGVILYSTKGYITLLTQAGQSLRIQKHDIIGLARYSISNFTIDSQSAKSSQSLPPAFQFVTRIGFNQFQTVTGWPNGYTNEYVQIFGIDQQEYQILRTNIWDVEELPEPRLRPHSQRVAPLPSLSDPLEFKHCRLSKSHSLPPYASYAREIELKSYFDSILAGQEQVYEYRDEKVFYAVPQIHENFTRLGTTFLINSRYSDAGSRRVNLLPYVIDSLSEGPFTYQRTISSGVAPIEWILHTEPILSAHFALKVSYIHFEFFLDPSVILLGDRYRWSSSHLDSFDERHTPAGGGRFGIDIGSWSLFFMTSQIHTGARTNSMFVNLTHDFPGGGIKYQSNRFQAEVVSTSKVVNDHQKVGRESTDAEFKADIVMNRLNLALKWDRSLNFKLSLVHRQTEIEAVAKSDKKALWEFDSTAHDLAFQVDYDINYRWRLYTRAMVESIHREAVVNGSKEHSDDFLYGKGAVGLSLAF